MTHAALVEIAARWLRGTRHCRVVLAEKAGQPECPDAIGWGTVCASILVEAKVSRADFRRDRQKPSRHPASACAIGTERWYLTPPGLLRVDEVPEPWGLLEWTGRIVLRRKRAAVVTLDPFAARRELLLLVAELSAYQAQGIRYQPLPRTRVEARMRALAHEEDVLEARILLGLESPNRLREGRL